MAPLPVKTQMSPEHGIAGHNLGIGAPTTIVFTPPVLAIATLIPKLSDRYTLTGALKLRLLR